MTESSQSELLSLLAARQGHFRFESGHHGDLWLDLDQLFLHASRVRRFALELADRLSSHNVRAVCGPLVGGALLAQTIAAELGAEFYFTERFVLSQPDTLYPAEYRLPDSLHQSLRDKRVAIVDDVINAGSAVRGTMTTLESCGAKPVVIGALLVLGAASPGYFAERSIPMESLAHQSSNLWTPSDCPLCARQIPLENILANGPTQ